MLGRLCKRAHIFFFSFCPISFVSLSLSGYVLSHAFGSVLDNPDLITLAVVGDGEAETGPLEGSWKGISFLNPVRDGAVLPILHDNGYQISGPTIMGRESDDNIRSLFTGHGYEVMFVEGDQPLLVHQALAKTMDYAVERIRAIQKAARSAGSCTVRPRWPLIILRTPKGWTGPKNVDGKKIEGTNFAHQVPLAGVRENPDHLKQLEQWLRSYKPEELFTEEGRLKPEIQALAPKGDRRMSAQPYTNGGKNVSPLKIPDLNQFALQVPKPAFTERVSSVAQLGLLCNELYKLNPTNFRLFCPDETNSNKLGAVFNTQKRAFMLPLREWDDRVGPDGRVMEVLSEHLCEGWMEGYLLTGRHGLLATYEAFAMVMVSMVLQSIKWQEVVAGDDETGGLTWRKQLPSINVLLTSTCWRNDHNGFSHQGPSFVDTCIVMRGSVIRAYFPVDGNTMLAVAAHCFETRNRVNIIVQDKQVQLQYLTMEQAVAHQKAGISRWDWASTDKDGEEPDVVLACCGDVMTMELLAAAAYLRTNAPGLKVRFINVLDLMRLPLPDRHPHGMPAEDFNKLFTTTAPVIFAYHSHPNTLHELIHRRPCASERFHVRGFREEGTTTTPFDMSATQPTHPRKLGAVVSRFSRARTHSLCCGLCVFVCTSGL